MILLNIALVILSIIGLGFFISGLQKDNKIYMHFGGIAFLSPIFSLVGWFLFLPLVPGINLLIIIWLTRKREKAL